MLEARRATKAYRSATGDVMALSGVDLVVRQGEFVIVIGPSGSGKSTLLNVLAGLDTVDEGKVYYRSRALSDYSDAQRTPSAPPRLGGGVSELRAGAADELLPQHRVSATAGASASGREAASRATNCRQLLIGDLLGRRISAVSMGQRQRIAIARALVVEPEVVLGDEITASLDSDSSRRIYALLRRQQRSAGRTFVMVTHDSSLVESTDRVLHLRDGTLR